jgi:hypothetical protein
MKAVDEPVGLVQLSAQRQPVATVASGAAGRCAKVAALRGFEFLRNGGNVFVQLSQQRPRLSSPSVVNHVWIVSSILDVCAAGSWFAGPAIGASSPGIP